MADEPEGVVLQLLRGIRAEMATKAELKAEIQLLRAGVAADLVAMQAKVDAEHKATRKQLGDQIAGLRRAVVEYHSVVVGHGVLISELEARMRRVEQHLDLPAFDGH
ncbi:MAG: hypothetical protein ABR878_00400 [Roseiarcus sp.]|jgi:hypothetical protein